MWWANKAPVSAQCAHIFTGGSFNLDSESGAWLFQILEVLITIKGAGNVKRQSVGGAGDAARMMKNEAV